MYVMGRLLWKSVPHTENSYEPSSAEERARGLVKWIKTFK